MLVLVALEVHVYQTIEYKVLKGLYFRFSIQKALRNVLSLGISDRRSCEGLTLDVIEFFIDKTFLNQHHFLVVKSAS